MDTTGSIWMPPEGSTMASEVDSLFYFILWASVFFLAVVTFASIWFIIRYRRRGEPGLTTPIAHNTPLEVVWTVVPTILIVIVFIWGFRDFLKLNIIPHDAIEIKVTGQRWFWSFDYKEGANTVNELVVPVDKPVKLLMSSQDVIHSFFVPNFRVKMDVLPNRYTITWFEATRTGEYDLFCTEYCGKGHSEMLGKVRVVTTSEYQKWLEEGSSMGEGVSLEEYGAQLYVKRACNTCHSIDGSANVAPTFKNIFGHDVFLSDGSRLSVDENYIRESILNPRAKIVQGYDPVMPTFQGILKDRQVDALIAYIKSLSDNVPHETEEN
jgi:cytochrome c oxidase subunit 2